MQWLLSDVLALVLNQKNKRGKYQSLRFVVGKRKKKRNIKHSWLRCDKTESIELLWCTSCRKFEDKIQGVKNFYPAWISGSANHRMSNLSDQHKLSMCLMCAN